MRRILIISAICITVVAAAVSSWLLFFAQPLAAPISTTAAKASEQIDPIHYEKFSDKPARMRIPTLEIDAPVLGVGLTSEGAMGAPNNLIDVGWYNKSARLGEDSKYSVLMDGHYGSPWDQGVFYNLYKIKVEDQIYMATESGEEAVFKDIEIERKALE
ncbi:MAG TPA: class F sortase, partial [Candidatus Saccharibacteria bacterium]|nr:class F sortase [Candidatus Saccharibacteria bacterium]